MRPFRMVSEQWLMVVFALALLSGAHAVKETPKIELPKKDERELKMMSYKKYKKGSMKYQYAQMYNYHYYPQKGQPKYQPQYPPLNPSPYKYDEPMYQPQYPPKNPPPYGQPKYQPQYPPKNHPPPSYKGKGKGAVFGGPHHMKIRKMAKGGYGNFFPRIPGPGTDDEGSEIPFGIWPRIPQTGPTEQPATSAPVAPTLDPTAVPISPTSVPTSGPTSSPIAGTSVPTSGPTSNPTPTPAETAAPVASTSVPTGAPVTFEPTSQICTSGDVSVAGFSLVNSATNEVLSAVASGDTLDLDALEETYGVDEFSIVCNTQGPVESVQFVEDFTLPNDGDNTNEETTVNEAPYQLDGNLAAGEYSVSCQPFCEDDLGGASSDAATVDFTVTQLDCSTCTAACIAITDFVLVDADKDLNVADPTADYLVVLQEGQEYSLSALQQEHDATSFALLCITDPEPFSQVPFEIGSVGLRDNNYRTHVGTSGGNPLDRDYNSEGSPPYTLADDNSGDYNPTDFTLGEAWSITCQAFCEGGLQGDESVPVTRTFRMVA